MTNSTLTARQISDLAMLVVGLIVLGVVAFNVGDVLTTMTTLVSGFFDSLTPANPNGTVR